MDLRKPHPLDHLFSALVSNRRVVSGFGLGVVASLVVLSCIVSVRTPPTISSSLFSWFDSVSDGVSHPESQKSPGLLQVNEREAATEKTHDGNPPKSCFTGREPGLEETHEGNLAGDAKDSSFLLNREETLDGNLSASSGPDALKTPAGNLIVGGENSSDLVNPGLLGETHDENLSKGCCTGREPDVLKSHVGNRTGKSNDTSNAVNAKYPLNRNHDGEPPTSPFTGSEPGSLTGGTKGSGIPVNAANSSGKTLGQDASEDFYKMPVQSEKINEAGISSSNATSPSGGTVVVGRTQSGSTSEDHASGEGFKKKDGVDEKDHGRNGVDGERKYVSRGSDQRGASKRIREGAGENNRSRSGSTKRREGFYQTCDIYNGSWVRDERKPFYPAGSCPYIDDDFNCHKNGRPDDGFLRWRWQPYDCNIPRLNATDFLERLRGKRLIFVGDSLNRNMWESLICILRDSVYDKSRVYEVAGRSEFKTKGYYAIRFEDYSCSVDFVRSPFLVQEVFLKNVNGSEDEKLRLDRLDETTSAYREADVIVFNTGHWWTHEKTSSGIDYYQEGNYVHPVLKAMEAYKRALTTWGRWVDKNINPNKTQVVFRGYSLTHFRGGQWNSGGQCHKETDPIFNDSFLAKYPSKMRALEWVLEQMRTPVIYLNVSRITDYRKDGHPSIYRKTYRTVEEQIAAEKSQDCSHWCLPGIPDTWNELLYASLLMDGQGSWRR